MTNRLHLSKFNVILGLSLSAALGNALAGNSFPLLSNCFEDGERLTEVTAADEIRVRYASAAGGVKPCYAVQVTKEGRMLTGFLMGARLPVIERFEEDIRKHVPQAPPPVAVSRPASAPPVAEPLPGPKTLSGLRAADINGNPVDLSAMPEKHLVVYFWSASDKKAIDAAEAMEGIHSQFAAPRKLEFVSIATAKSFEQYKRAAEGAEATWPQILDKAKLADRYHVDPAKPILIVDRARNVLTAVANPRDLIDELNRMGRK